MSQSFVTEPLTIYQDFVAQYKALYYHKDLAMMICSEDKILSLNPAMANFLFNSDSMSKLGSKLSRFHSERLQESQAVILHLGSKQSSKKLYLLSLKTPSSAEFRLLAFRMRIMLSTKERPQFFIQSNAHGKYSVHAMSPAAKTWLELLEAPQELFSAIHPLDQSAFLEFLNEAPDHPSSRIHVKLKGPDTLSLKYACQAYPLTGNKHEGLLLIFEETLMQDAFDLRHRQNQEALHDLFESSRDPMLIVDLKSKIQEGNLAFYQKFGFKEDLMRQKDLNDLLADSILDRRLQPVHSDPTARVQLNDYYSQSHELCVYELPVYLEDAPIGKYITFLAESVKPASAFKKLSQSINQTIPPQTLLLDKNMAIQWTSGSNWISGEFSAIGILQQNFSHYVAKQSQAEFKYAIAHLESGDAAWFGSLWLESPGEKQKLRHVLMAPLKQSDGTLEHYICHLYPIYREREINQLIHRLSYLDPDTELHNATALTEALHEQIYESSARNERFAIVQVALHSSAGCQISLTEADSQMLLETLLEVMANHAELETECFRTNLTGVTVILKHVHLENELQRLLTTLLRGLSSRLELLGFEDNIHLSFSHALYPFSGQTPEALLDALAVSKQHHESHFGGSNLNEQLAEAQRPKEGMIERYLREGLPKGEFYIVYQPLIDLKTKRITGMETLLRWHSDTVGSLSPGEFIPIAEKSNLIVKLGYFVIGETIRKLYQLREKGHMLTSSVNISLKQLEEPDFAAKIIDMLDTYELPENAIEFEITESITISAHPMVTKNIEALTQFGIAFNVDDFGTGYSSLKQMQQLAIKSLKVDRSIIEDMVDNPANQSLVKAISAMAKSSGLKLIAEGVETSEQLAVLEQIGFEEAQGFLFSMPLKDQELERFIENHESIHHISR